MEDVFFKNFKQAEVDFKEHFDRMGVSLSNSQNTKYDFSILNINPVFKLIDDYLKNEEMTEFYNIKVGSTPFSVSEELYNTESLWWLILYANNMTGFDFIMNNNEMSDLAKLLFQKEGVYTSKKVYFDLVFDFNEKRKKILVFKTDKINEIMRNIAGELS